MDNVNVRHDASVTLTLSAGRPDARFVVEESVIPITSLNGAITRMSVMYNALGVSGGTAWFHPGTGERLVRPQYTYELTDPDVQILKPGELCTCTECVPCTT